MTSIHPPALPAAPAALVSDIRQLVESSRSELARVVNGALTLLYWQIGQRIRDEVLRGERAEYGEQIVSMLARQLEADFGRGFSSKNLRHMLRFVEAYPDAGIVSALSRQLAWSHFLELIYLKDPLQRDFYAQMCEQEHWSVRQLRERKGTLLFERTALSRQPDQLLTQELASLREAGELAPALVLKDPYILDFLGLQDRYVEKDLEDAILRELEQFLLELGASGIHVAEYLTQLPPKSLLQQKLHDAIARSRARLDNRSKE